MACRFLSAVAVLALIGCTRTVVIRELPASPASDQHPSAVETGEIIVARGDTLYGIATGAGVTLAELAAWNDIDPPYTIQPGQRLVLQSPTTTAPVAIAQVRAEPEASPSGPVESTPAPAPAPAPVLAPAPAPAPSGDGLHWRWPADGPVINPYVDGKATDRGIDIGGPGGAPVRAAADGVVVYSGSGLAGYGEIIIIKHRDPWLSAYGHNRKRLVREGDAVKAGEQIAELGRTEADRDKLHFELRNQGAPVDPSLHLPKR